jgi:hypothetical protein
MERGKMIFVLITDKPESTAQSLREMFEAVNLPLTTLVRRVIMRNTWVDNQRRHVVYVEMEEK